MISYAQNGEDVVLRRALPGAEGFYVDVGAADPVVDSISKSFYDRGWSGINVEPAAPALEALLRDRPRDINLGVGAGAAPATLTFHELPTAMIGCSSFSEDVAARYEREGWTSTARTVEILTLARICEEHVGGRTIDFLKIDVEGNELAVLRGADFARFRPRILVIEATEPGTSVPSHAAWEPLVVRANYHFALFDGLNRFYVREEDIALRDLLSIPANVLDGYEPFRLAESRREVDRLQAELRSLRAVAELGDDIGALRGRLQAAEIALISEREEIRRSRAALQDARTELHAARRALSGVVGAGGA